MTFRASRAVRLLAAAITSLGVMGLYAQAAPATHSKVQIVKINQGGDPNDAFTFDTHLTPAPSPASFSLNGGATSATYWVDCNAPGDCTRQWGTLTQTVSERPAAGYTMTAVACRHTVGSGNWGAEPGASSALDPDTTVDLAQAKITFKLDWWERVKCYVTNTRDSATITLTKRVVAPAGDSGRFNLLIDVQVKAAGVADAGSTGAQTVATGTHTVSETAAAGTNLADYSAQTSCVNTAHPALGPDTDGTVSAAKGDRWECTITNTRKTATITLTKALAPAGDPGRFNLLIDGQVKAADVSDAGSTGALTVLPGSHSISETAAGATDLADYTTALQCTDAAHHDRAPVTSPTVTVAAGEDWRCLLSNTRKPAIPTPAPTPTPTPTPTDVSPAAAQSQSPQAVVKAARVRPGAATLSAPRGCAPPAATVATVTGRRIAKVTFYLDARKVKTLNKANAGAGRYALKLTVRQLALGTHRVSAKVQFAASSQTKARTLNATVSRCRPAVITPKFTG